ncbi:uncharacterized protein N7500_007291 [Penicillium coprophilum]|uniref:uncharacterized protein n=1 Tax=Penicillium coprophilum TaxID=36646 RepID=UPI0023A3B798|nr:uncharacterized protein N7500_007291 [Penicillium coprophilum]KAJ5165461.1 hypothetical protein N7500_007291 [Penicillium coprophilum]
MASTISYDGPNSGIQVGQNHGHITAQFPQSETSLNQACLRDLRTTDPRDDKDRIEKTNGGLLRDSYSWILENREFIQWQESQSSRLLWIRGDPGKGKTMLLCGVIEELTRSIEDTANISFFFCQATDVRINNAAAVLRGLIYSLVEKQPKLLSYVRSRYDQAGKSLFEDINAFNALSRIFRDILKDLTSRRTYLVIDALDECIKNLHFLLDLVVEVSSTYTQLKWIVSSRNWPDIEERLGTTTQTTLISLELNEVYVSEAVKNFIQQKVQHLANVKNYEEETRDTIYRHLSLNSQGTFLWVALACQDLERTSRRHTLKKLKAFPPGLNALYSRMIDQVCILEDAELCKRILAIMSIVYRPITIYELPFLIEIPNDLLDDHKAISEIITICGSFLTLRENTIIFVHQSAKEFLLREAREMIFAENIEAEHHLIYLHSLKAMSKILRRDIFGTEAPGLPIIKDAQPCPNPLTAVEYACVYWVDHLQEGWCDKNDGSELNQGSVIDIFLQQKYLHWIEALGHLGNLFQGIAAILKLDAVFHAKGESQPLLRRVRDACRFIQYHRPAIENSPHQVYISSLIFSPMNSITRNCYLKERPAWVLNEPVIEKNWGPCLQALEGHYDSISSIAWSQHKNRLASGSHDNTIRIWDPDTGQCALVLQGHNDWIKSIAWSQDESRLASGSSDRTVRIWDPVTGQCVLVLKGHSDSVRSIAWSQDGSRLASGSSDMTVRFWDLVTGQCISTAQGHSDSVWSIAWSQDDRIASGSFDNTVRIWDLATGQCALTLHGHNDWVKLIAWTQNGSRLVSGSYDNTLRIWHPVTGQCIAVLLGHTGPVESIAWSQCRNQLASGSSDKTIKIWNPTTGRCILTLGGHSSPVESISWSQDGSRLASASNRTVRIWDPATGQCVSTLQGHSGLVRSIAWLQDDRLASGSYDNTVRIWDPDTAEYASNFERHSLPITSIAWSPDGSRLASASRDTTARIWDPCSSRCLLILRGHTGPVSSIAWSQDGKRLASGSYDNTIKIWDPSTGQYLLDIQRLSDFVISIAWSQDGSRLASGSTDKTVRIWDLATGRCELNLKGHSASVSSIAWSQDGTRLASGSYDNKIRIWDPATGQCLSILQGQGDIFSSITWSQDGNRLASGSFNNAVRIWDPATAFVSSISFFPSNALDPGL